MRRRSAIVYGILICLVLGSLGAYSYHRKVQKWKYPYGRSHSCLVHMRMAFNIYADDNKGKFPAGGKTPEASLSLLYNNKLIHASILAGMTVPRDVAERILDRGETLGPETCGWHYVEGLSEGANPELAILWCKEALGHYGQRTTNNSREVLFVDGTYKPIPGDQWDAFLKEQQKLFAQRSEREKAGFPLVSATVLSPEGTQIKGLQGAYQHWDIFQETGARWTNSGSGSSFNPNDLVIHRAPIQAGSLTRIVSFSNLISAPVTVTFSDGIASPTNAIFQMKRKPEE